MLVLWKHMLLLFFVWYFLWGLYISRTKGFQLIMACSACLIKRIRLCSRSSFILPEYSILKQKWCLHYLLFNFSAFLSKSFLSGLTKHWSNIPGANFVGKQEYRINRLTGQWVPFIHHIVVSKPKVKLVIFLYCM